MKAWNKQPDTEPRERYLGEIAPLLEAAREVEMLSHVAKRQVRKRILRTLFGTKSRGLRGRLVPVLVALALLVFGGAAFATAQRLGLLPRLRGQSEDASPTPSSSQARKRRGMRGRPSTQAVAVADQEPEPGVEEPATVPLPVEARPIALPATPEPPPTHAPAAIEVPPSSDRARHSNPSAGPTTVAAPFARKGNGRFAGLPATSASKPAPSMGAPAPVIPAPPDVPATAAPTFVPAPVMPNPMPMPAPLPAPAASPVGPAPVAMATPSPPAPAVLALRTAPPSPPAQAQEAARSAAPDQALFGQALRKLRADDDAAGALAILRAHAKQFPKSDLAGERLTLEVEALLALHRDRDALALLDTMPLDKLPRSGERLVVRGELRAAARRWREAGTDFDRALSRVSGSPAWHERALWGRAVSRLRSGDRAAGLADLARYRESYPQGRFAAEAARLAPGQ